ncbi:MAG: hypothetical protein CMN30_05385 [Sandaracinus sp.]|nr:hypothetical protein [Sandaracinus sp.]
MTSLLAPRDSETRALLAELGVPASGLVPIAHLADALERAGFVGDSARLATYVANESVLGSALGRWVARAAENVALELMFDLSVGGLTQALARQLQDAAEGTVRFAHPPRDDRRGAFHPKTFAFRLRCGDEQLGLVIVGSANLTRAAMELNTELGVFSLTRLPAASPPSSLTACGWPEAEEALGRFSAHCVELASLLELPATAAEQSRSDAVNPVVLRPYQRDAVAAIVDAVSSGKRPRTLARSWLGGMVVLPPAAGKTLIALTALRRLVAAGTVRRAVWLAPSPRLSQQAFVELGRSTSPQGLEAHCVVEDHIRSIPDRQVELFRAKAFIRHLSAQPREHAPPQVVFLGKDWFESRLRRESDSLAGWPDLVIVDEAHHAIARGWLRVLEQLAPAHVLGLTATPFIATPTSDATTTLLNAFPSGTHPWLECFPARLGELSAVAERRGPGGHVVYGMSPQRFFALDREREPADRVLAEPVFETVPCQDTKGDAFVVRPPKTRGPKSPHQYLEETLGTADDDLAADRSAPQVEKHRAAHLDSKGVPDAKGLARLLTEVDRDAAQRVLATETDDHVFVAARSTAHAEILAQRIREAAADAPHPPPVLVLHSKDLRSAAERRSELETLRRSGGGILVGVDMLSEGFDLPSIGLIVVARWTASERLFWQLVGRGLRGPASGGTAGVRIRLYDLDFAVRKRGEPTDAVLRRASQVVRDTLMGELEPETQPPLTIRRRRARSPATTKTNASPAQPRKRKAAAPTTTAPKKTAARPWPKGVAKSGPLEGPAAKSLERLWTSTRSDYEVRILDAKGRAVVPWTRCRKPSSALRRLARLEMSDALRTQCRFEVRHRG